MPSLFVIILNWNGWKDTIECLDSLQKSDHPDYRLIVVDNGSTDGSCERFRDWAAVRQLDLVEFTKDEADTGGEGIHRRSSDTKDSRRLLVIVRNGDNLGFAAGNNVGMRYALACDAKYVMLLNNDTAVAPGALSWLTGFLNDHPDVHAVTGQTRYFGDTQKIWNCGGDLTWYGTRRYHHAGAAISGTPQHGGRTITFMTGCAPMFRAELLRSVGLFTTRFFFGEEDFEFSLRLKTLGRRMACCYDAIIYHKVGASINQVAAGKPLGMTYIYYLNRLIDLRLHWPAALWKIWRMIYIPYIAVLSWKEYKLSLAILMRFLISLSRESSRRQGVDRAAFETAMKLGYLPAAV